ncbi:N-6 DNA methylase [Mesorhizobium argentiipisi]|uniref:N-6 DNA methylase n=1 Tax=Mesorhizobium argentiipisi TaxID=3015175 RepID=A0ABU8KJ99_9HYPH
MSGQRNREEVVNTQLALLISTLGVTADAETIHVHGKHRPDVLFQLRGLRVAIEGKFSDTPNADEVVLRDARNRVRAGIAHIAAATVYPIALRSAPTTKVLDTLAKSRLRYRIVTETFEWDEWFEGDPASLMGALRRAQEALTQDDIVEQTAKALNVQLSGVAKLWMGQAGACDRLSSILGIKPPKGETPEKAEARRETAAKVSALVLANALIFQDQLAATDGRVAPLRKTEKESDLVGDISKHWRWIWENINYVPIFQLGERVLDELPVSPHTTLAVKSLLAEAKSICEKQAALRHDLMGRIYHWLLHHAKYLGTYYTSVSAATLLLKIALAAKWKQDFGDPVELANFKVADLACGTGTLLMAAAQAFADEYIRKRAATDRSLEPKDLSTLHRTLMENVLHGYDVLPSAVHLTASTLALLAPDIAFVRMNLYVMPMGIDHGNARLGSLDFLDGSEIKTQIALDYSQAETLRTGASMTHVTNAKVPKLDLCVMNPPFVRSVGGNLLFGSLPDERGAMQTELKQRVKNLSANVTAGLGSVFVALADKHLEKGGRLAFVLPAALATGEAWGPTRKLIADKYHLETVISSHDASRPNFSENTDLSELLFVARKLAGGEKPGRTTYISLWRNPRSIHEAMHLANDVEHVGPVAAVEGVGVTSVRTASGKVAEMVTMPPAAGEEIWQGAIISQAELLRVSWSLQGGTLRLPGNDKGFAIPMAPLSDLGELGYDRRDIHDAFEISHDDWSPYPAFWGHDAEAVTTIAQTSTARLMARTKAAPGRKLKSATSVWSKSGRILVAERLRTNTQKLVALGFSEPVLGNTWWAVSTASLDDGQIKALLLFLNSSFGIALYFARRVITEGAFVQMKKPAWASMPVLDVRSLQPSQLAALGAAYDRVATQPLQPIAKLASDKVRIDIDDTLCKVLQLPSISPIRELLEREPGLSNREIAPRQKSGMTAEMEDSSED